MCRTSYYQRNKVKRREYQQEYAQQKRSPGRRKVSRAERKPLEEQHKNRRQLMAMENLHIQCCRCPGSFGTYCSLESGGSQTYYRYDGGGRKAIEYFEEMKDIFQMFDPCRWMKAFQKCVDDFVQDQLLLATGITFKPVIKEEDRVRLHGLRRLVAGAIQEGELVRQPRCHVTWAKMDSMIVWDG